MVNAVYSCTRDMHYPAPQPPTFTLQLIPDRSDGADGYACCPRSARSFGIYCSVLADSRFHIW